MKKTINLIYILTLILTHTVYAQSITKIDTLSGTELKVSSNKNINALMEKLEKQCQKNTPMASGRSNSSDSSFPTSSSDRATSNERISVSGKKLTTAEICQKNPRIMGYKIQVAVVKNNKDANDTKLDFRKKFPYIKVETDASLRPNYKILAGSYFSKASAANDLRKIKEHFKSATTVQYYIFCEEGK